MFGNTCGVSNVVFTWETPWSIQAFFMHRCMPRSFSKAILVACGVNLGISDVSTARLFCAHARMRSYCSAYSTHAQLLYIEDVLTRALKFIRSLTHFLY